MLTPKISRILDAAIAGAADFGDSGLDVGVDRMRMALQQASTQALTFLKLAAGMAALLFIVMIWLLVRFSGDPVAFTAILTAIGVTFAGLIGLVLRIAREHTQGALLAELATTLPSQDVREVMLNLLNKEKEPPVELAKNGVVK